MIDGQNLNWADLPTADEEDNGILPEIDIDIDIDIDPPFSGGSGSGSLIGDPAVGNSVADIPVSLELIDTVQALAANFGFIVG